MARKRVTAKKATKKATALSGKATALSSIEVDVDLGDLKATEEQQARLRAHLDSTLLTWVKYDLKEKTARPLIIIDHHGPPNG
jgi:hypothetical protein